MTRIASLLQIDITIYENGSLLSTNPSNGPDDIPRTMTKQQTLEFVQSLASALNLKLLTKEDQENFDFLLVRQKEAILKYLENASTTSSGVQKAKAGNILQN